MPSQFHFVYCILGCDSYQKFYLCYYSLLEWQLLSKIVRDTKRAKKCKLTIKDVSHRHEAYDQESNEARDEPTGHQKLPRATIQSLRSTGTAPTEEHPKWETL